MTEVKVPETTGPDRWRRVTLFGVDWATYGQLRDARGNDHVRMSYLDGTLTLMSPELAHDGGVVDLEILVRSACTGLGLEVRSLRSTTLRRGATLRERGGKEPDAAFYLGENERRMRKKTMLDLNIDPPPDLAIEVENTQDSAKALPIYAKLGVPEVWRYVVRAKALRFERLEGGIYVEVARSVALPRLTPALILQAIDAFHSARWVRLPGASGSRSG